MKKSFSLLLIISGLGTQLHAQPSAVQVKTDFQKNGVTAVEGITIDKETHLDHNRWKASFKTVTPVKPEEVNGQAGVTLVKQMNAWYECKGKVCKMTLSSLAGSEYKGMDIPAPDHFDLVALVKKVVMTEPSYIVTSMDNKVSFDSVKVTEPQIEWLTPQKLVFAAKLYYTEKINTTEHRIVESPLSVTADRNDLNASFKFLNAKQNEERNVELGRKKITNVSAKPDLETAPAPPVAGAWKKGDKVMVEENGKWYPATILFARNKEWFIRYDGYDAQFDEWAGLARIKNK